MCFHPIEGTHEEDPHGGEPLLYCLGRAQEAQGAIQMTLGYLGKKKARDVEWRAVLAFLVQERKVTARQVASAFGLGHEISVVEFRGPNRREVHRTRHTGPIEANTRLRRLAQWGMARREEGEDGVTRFVITDYGREVDANPGESPRKQRRSRG